MMPTNSQTDRRQYVRHEIRLDAVIHSTVSDSIQCTILNFCEGGLLVEFQTEQANQALVLGTDIKLQFRTPNPRGDNGFLIEANVVRRDENSAGIAFARDHLSACNALLQATKSTSFKSAASDSDKLLSVTENSARFNLDAFNSEFIALLKTRLPELLEPFFHQTRDALFECASHAHSNTAEESFFDVIKLLDNKENSVKTIFCDILIHNISASESNNTQRSDSAIRSGSEEITLVDEDEFEDWLSLASVAAKLEKQCNAIVNTLTHKFGFIAKASKGTPNNPIGPGEICNAFQKALEAININDTTREVKQLIFASFETVILTSAPDLYEAINSLLIKHKVREERAPKTRTTQHTPAAPQHDISEAQPALATNNLPPEQYHSTDNLPAPGSKEQNVTNTATQRTGGQTNTIPQFSSARASSVVRTMRSLATLIEQDNVVAHSHSQSMPSVSNQANAEALPAWSTDEKIAAFRTLQSEATLPNSRNADAGQNRRQQFLGALAELTDDPRMLSDEDLNVADSYERIFASVRNNLLYSGDAKTHIDDMHWPLYSLSLQDPEFLESDSHPARRMLDKLALLDGGYTDNSETKVKIDNLVARVTTEAISNPNVYSDIDQGLTDIVEPYLKKRKSLIRRVIEECEGKQHLANAQKQVEIEIDHRLPGPHIPKSLHSLLEIGWRELMRFTYLRDGDQSEAWLLQLDVIDKLHLWLTSGKPLSLELYNDFDRIIKIMDTQFSSSNTVNFLYEKTKQQLITEIKGRGEPPVIGPIDTIEIEPKKPVDKDTDKRHQTLISPLNQLAANDWLTFAPGDEAPEPLQLVWIGEQPRNYVFVNRKGLKIFETGPDQLTELLNNGNAIKIESLEVPVMDRATNLIIQNMHDRVRHTATHDSVTNLINGKECIRKIDLVLSQPDFEKCLFCYLELLDFQIISDNCGIEASEDCIRQLTDIFPENHDGNLTTARIGETTFGLILQNCSVDRGYDQVSKLRDRIVTYRFEQDDKSYAIGISIALVPLEIGGTNANALMRNATSTCQVAKNSGRNAISIYTPDSKDIETQKEIDRWIGQIDHLLSSDRLFLRCQLIESLDSSGNDQSHREVLLGVKDDDGHGVSPEHLIYAAEYSQRMVDIDQWVITKFFTWMGDNPDILDIAGGFSINLSGQSLNSSSFSTFLKTILNSKNISPEKITFEITETAAINNLILTQKFIREFKELGYKFSLDDFGTGSSSYAYLRALAVDYLKIDGTFVKEIHTCDTDKAMVKSMNEIGHSLGMKTIAEYVEIEEIKPVLTDIGVDYAQGWAVQKPILLSELGASISSSPTL